MTNAADDERVAALFASPTDAELCARGLVRAGVHAVVYTDPAVFSQIVSPAITAVVAIAERALKGRVSEVLMRLLDEQPDWSSLPLILLYDALPGDVSPMLNGCITLRCVMPQEDSSKLMDGFVSTVQMALDERRRQYRVRDLLAGQALQICQRNEFMGLLGHELRNPLAAIEVSTEVLQELGPGSGPVAECIEILASQSAHLKCMLDELSDASRLARDNLTLKLEPLELVAVLKRCRERIRDEFAAQGQTLRLDLPAEPLWLLGDTTRLQQIFVNLLQDAARRSDPGGLIELSARRVDGQAQVQLRDTGKAMSEEAIAHVFEPFYQGEDAVQRATQKGLGLGLSVAARLVDLHGGAIRARSDGVCREFLVTLPLRRGDAIVHPEAK